MNNVAFPNLIPNPFFYHNSCILSLNKQMWKHFKYLRFQTFLMFFGAQIDVHLPF
jgi:hypothetical protein